MGLPVQFDADLKSRFLALYGICGQLQRSAKEVGISPATVRNHLKVDPDFKAAFKEAYGDFQEAIEREAYRRALMGWEEPVFQQGLQVGTIRKFDSRLLELMLKRHNPEYKESFTVDHNVTGGIMVVPQLESKPEWEKRNAIDAEVVDETPTNEEQNDG